MTIETSVSSVPARSAATPQALRRWGRACLGALVRALIERDARFRASCQLARMEDHLLRDIGLTRDDVRGGRP
jgi:uncharacterized protein YjiS (DUF1127 family)